MKNMQVCCICHKKVKKGNVAFFKIPKDELILKKWSKIFGENLKAGRSLCEKHFSYTDIVKVANKFFLAPEAVPFVQSSKREEIIPSLESNKSQDTDVIASVPNYIHINTVYMKSKPKCRCCTNPTSNLIQLENCSISSEGLQKTYKDLLHEITNLNITIDEEKFLPQKICSHCQVLLESSYKFIHQICQMYQHYLNLVEKDNIWLNKSIECVPDSFVKGTQGLVADNADKELKIEHLNIEYGADVTQENIDSETFFSKIFKYEEYQEDRNYLHNFSDDDSSIKAAENIDNSELVQSIEMDLNESIAICCDICHKVYRNEKLLKDHKHHTHGHDEKKLSCSLCCYKVSQKAALKRHLSLVHSSYKVNENCKLAFDETDVQEIKYVNNSKKEKLQKKTKFAISTERRFVCTYCKQSYNTRTGLKLHVMVHTGERPFSCEICNKTFKQSRNLELHRVIHSDKKPYQCPECYKAFKRADKLKMHMRVHSTLRPYKCKECDKTFKYPSVLRTHMQIHTR